MAKKRERKQEIVITASGERAVAIGSGVHDVVAVTGDNVTVIKGGQEAILTEDVLAHLTIEYLHKAEQDWRKLKADEEHPPLESVFFMLQARERGERRPLEPPRPDLPPDPERRAAADALPAQPLKPPPQPMPLGDVLKKESRLVILGEPGAGKTTALQFVALCFARRTQWEHKERLGIETPWIPILLNLPKYASALAETGRTLFDVLVSEVYDILQSHSVAEVNALLKFWQKSDGVLVLLDGLDEVNQSQSVVREKIASLRLENTRLVVTSRPAGSNTLGDLKEYTLKPLDEKEALAYLSGWMQWLKQSSREEAEKDASRLHEQMRQQPALRRLLNNPLLLRLSAEYYLRSNGDIPRNRAVLYSAWVEEAWKRAKTRGAEETQKERALAALEVLAWHRQVGGENTEQALLEALQKYPVFIHGKRQEQLAADEQEAAELLTLLHEKTGLLMQETERRGVNDVRRYFFAHQTLREYFVARRLQRAWEQNPKRTFRFLKPRLHLPEWEDVFYLLVAGLPKSGALMLLRKMRRAKSPEERYVYRDLFLVLKLAREHGYNKDIWDEIKWHLQKPLLVENVWLNLITLGQLLEFGLSAAPILRHSLEYKRHHFRSFKFIWSKIQRRIRKIRKSSPYIVSEPSLENVVPDTICSNIVWALGKIKDQDAIPLLLRLLEDERYLVAISAEEALSDIGEAVIPHLAKILNDKNSNLHWAAIRILQRIGSKAIPTLQKTLTYEDSWVRERAAEALKEILAKRSDVRETKTVRGQPFLTFSAPASKPARTPSELSVLVEGVTDEREDVRKSSVIEIYNIGVSSLPVLVNSLANKREILHAETIGLLALLFEKAAMDNRHDSLQGYLISLRNLAHQNKDYRLLWMVVMAMEIYIMKKKSPWQDPLQPTPVEARLLRIRPALVWLSLAGALALLGVLAASAADVLKDATLPFLKAQPLVLVIGLLLLLAVLTAGLERLLDRWKK